MSGKRLLLCTKRCSGVSQVSHRKNLTPIEESHLAVERRLSRMRGHARSCQLDETRKVQMQSCFPGNEHQGKCFKTHVVDIKLTCFPHHWQVRTHRVLCNCCHVFTITILMSLVCQGLDLPSMREHHHTGAQIYARSRSFWLTMHDPQSLILVFNDMS